MDYGRRGPGGRDAPLAGGVGTESPPYGILPSHILVLRFISVVTSSTYRYVFTSYEFDNLFTSYEFHLSLRLSYELRGLYVYFTFIVRILPVSYYRNAIYIGRYEFDLSILVRLLDSLRFLRFSYEVLTFILQGPY